MIEIYKNELRIDEVVLKYATAEEMTMLREIAKIHCGAIQKGM